MNVLLLVIGFNFLRTMHCMVRSFSFATSTLLYFVAEQPVAACAVYRGNIAVCVLIGTTVLLCKFHRLQAWNRRLSQHSKKQQILSM